MIAKDIKRGHIVNYNGSPCMIETINVQSPSARGAATFYKYRARNLITKQKVDITLRGGESLAEADFQKRPVKFMYADPAERPLPRRRQLRAILPALRRPERGDAISRPKTSKACRR